MRKPKKDEGDKTVQDFRNFGRVCLMVVSVFVIWGLLYMPLKTGSRMPLPNSLGWMVVQRNLSKYILPDNDTNVLIPKQSCNGRTFVVIIVCSAVPNFKSRLAIRNSWVKDAEQLHQIHVYFLLGKSSNEGLNAALVNESNTYRDIIQEDFLDTYNNLTLKSVMMLKWVRENCAKAKYVMKTDDDMFVNVPNLFRLLKAKGHKQMLLGCLFKNVIPIRDWNSKWYVPEAIFPGHVYPPYLSGTGYILSQDTVSILYRTSLNTPFFYLEDIFITGICAQRAGLKPVNHEGFKFYKRKSDTCVFRNLITAHKMKPNELIQMWKNIHKPSIKCK